MSKSAKNKKNAASKKNAAGGLGKSLTSSSAPIWKSRLSWRIALAVFLTILTVQVGILSITLKNYEQARLDELTDKARTAIAAVIQDTRADIYAPPIKKDKAVRLIEVTDIIGFALYPFGDLSVIHGPYGSGTNIKVRSAAGGLPSNYYNKDGGYYEALLKPADVGEPYYVTVRVDSQSVSDWIYEYVRQNIMIMMLMSAFVTTVLMIALGRWLLEPILFLRNNLLRASDNPEEPGIRQSPFDSGDEIGKAIDIANNLIRQNAENLKHIKSAAQDKIHRLAYYDTLTGLPNRTLFIQRLKEKIDESDNDHNKRYAVIALDLDHFKDINDTMGHNIGDAILRAVGKRLRAALPEETVVARSGEDEYFITMALTDQDNDPYEIAVKASQIIRSEPFKVYNENFQIRSSVGIATYPDDGVDPEIVMKNADLALNRAKEEGRDLIKQYSEDFDRAVQHRFQMLRDLRDALEQDQLMLYFQPQFDLGSGAVIGAEALIRWWKPDNSKEGGHFISPGEFIPIAEQSGLIVPIGEWVLNKACETAVAWNRAGHDIRIAVNVSGAQFYQSDLVEFVSKTIETTGLDPRKLELEVTESIFMDDINHAIITLQNLHSLGVEIAIDDFGTGYSSLSYLRQFPIDRLKIDQSFIRNALNNPDDASIAQTIVRLGHSLNLKVIAEGVETRDHEHFLKDQGCDEVQGFRYSKAIPDEDFTAFLEAYTGDLGSFDG